MLSFWEVTVRFPVGGLLPLWFGRLRIGNGIKGIIMTTKLASAYRTGARIYAASMPVSQPAAEPIRKLLLAGAQWNSRSRVTAGLP